jgi:hypothetical protein
MTAEAIAIVQSALFAVGLDGHPLLWGSLFVVGLEVLALLVAWRIWRCRARR